MRKIILSFAAMIAASFLLTCTAFATSMTVTGISSDYWGNYYNTSDDYYLLSITGSQSISFRGPYLSMVIACSTPSTIFFSPIATGTTDNFTADFSVWSKLVGNHYEQQAGHKLVGGHYNKDDYTFRIDGYYYAE